MPSENVKNHIFARRHLISNKFIGKSNLSLWSFIWGRLQSICIFTFNISLISLAVTRVCRKHSITLKSHRHFYFSRRRKSRRYSLNLPYIRLYVPGNGYVDRSFRLFLWITVSIYWLYRWRDHSSGKLSFCSCGEFFPYGRAKKSIGLSGEISHNIGINKLKLSKLTLVWTPLGESLWSVYWEFKGVDQSLRISMHFKRKSFIAEPITHDITTI